MNDMTKEPYQQTATDYTPKMKTRREIEQEIKLLSAEWRHVPRDMNFYGSAEWSLYGILKALRWVIGESGEEERKGL